MADRVLLLLGLCAVFGGLLALLTAGSRTGERKGVTRSLAIMETLKRPSPTLREKDLERPFAERVLGPLRPGWRCSGDGSPRTSGTSGSGTSWTSPGTRPGGPRTGCSA